MTELPKYSLIFLTNLIDGWVLVTTLATVLRLSWPINQTIRYILAFGVATFLMNCVFMATEIATLEALVAIVQILVFGLMATWLMRIPLRTAAAVSMFYQILVLVSLGISVVTFATMGYDQVALAKSNTLILLAQLVYYPVLLLLLYLFKTYRLLLMELEESSSQYRRAVWLHLFFTASLLALNYAVLSKTRAIRLDMAVLAGFITVAYLVFNMVYITVIGRLQARSVELDQQRFYNQSMQRVVDELRTIKHGHDNALAAIQGYVDHNDVNGLRQWLQEIHERREWAHVLNWLNSMQLQHIHNAGLLGLLTAKAQETIVHGLEFKLMVRDDVSEIKMRISDLCECLGILLDNAIEAAKETSDRSVRLEILRHNGRLSCIVENSTQEEINTARIFEKNYSTKGTGRGFGLWRLRRIVDRYQNVLIHTEAVGQRFRMELSIG